MIIDNSRQKDNQPICIARIAVALLGLILSTPVLATTLNENCIVSVLNRTVQVQPDGTWVLPNIPANSGPVRARATCIQNGLTTSGESAFFTVPVNGSFDVPPIVIGPVTPIPTLVTVSSSGATLLNQPGQSVQLLVESRYADGSVLDTTASSTGTRYLISNPALASVSANGLVTALKSGTAIVQAINEGTQGLLRLNIALSADSDGDGIPDDVELANGLDSNNPADALDDPDHDGLSNINEYVNGTNIRNPDTDGDGILDGEEMIAGADGFITNPLLKDTDGDGIPDNVEISSGSDPTNAASTNLAAALKAITVIPANAQINVNSVIGLGFTRLVVTGEFKLGGTIDLTPAARGTNYASSNLLVCNFGAESGVVYGGSNGPCTITVSNSGFTTTSQINVNFFAPTALSYISIPGYANNVDVAGNYAYVAAGSTGLQIVNVADRRFPFIEGALNTAGNANDVRVVGNLAYIADGAAGLQIIDVSVPTAPVLRGTYNTTGNANDVVVVGNRAYVADGVSGLQIIDVTNRASPVFLGTYDTPGNANGVAVSGNLAAVADGASGVRIVDVSNPVLPVSVGSIATVNALDVDVEGNIAYVADYTGSLKVIDFTNPASPRLAATTTQPLGGILADVVKAGRFVFGADVYFVNGVPIVDVTNPNNPLVRARLDFTARDDNGTGIAVDGQYIYLTAAFGVLGKGVIGDTRLYIGQYLIAEDKAGIAPVVSITSLQDNSTVVEGEPLAIAVNATDDTQVIVVKLYVNGQEVSSTSSPPYQFSYTVPSGVSQLTIGARATDLGGYVGRASDVSINVIPDPLTTVSGRVIDRNGQPISGATVTTYGGLTSSTAIDGTFVIPDVPTALGSVQVSATAIINGAQATGFSANVPAVRAGVSNVGDIAVSAIHALIPKLTSPTSASDVGVVTASSSYEAGGIYGVYKAMDDDPATLWYTNTIALGQWLKWSFTSPQAVSEFQYTTNNYFYNLLQYSDDNSTWYSASAVWQEGGGSFAHPTITGSTPHLHWRLIVNQVYGPTVANWYSYNRFQLYGSNLPRIVPISATASGTYSSFVPANAIDGNTGTAWNSGGFAPQWIYADLGEKRPISGVKILAGTGLPSGITYYDIQVSDDALSWTSVAKASSSALWGVTNISASGRYVRLYVTSHSGGSWIALHEFQVY